MIRRILTALALFVAVAGGFAVSASAQPLPMLPNPFEGCKEAPVPESPSMGMHSLMMPAPNPLPPARDPFAANPQTSILEQYGAAGTGWLTYDTGCMPGDGVQAKYQTAVANWLMLGARNGPSAVASVGNAALAPGWTSFIEGPSRAVSAALADVFSEEFMPLTILVAAVAVILMARRAHIGAAGTTAFMVLLAITLLSFSVNYPARISTGVADGLTNATAGLYQEVTDTPGSTTWTEADRRSVGTKMVSPLYEANVWDQWLTGMLGSATSPTAVKYGPDLFRASALTWHEDRIVQNDPEGAGKELIEAKQELWTETAEKIQAEDPIAYSYLTGQHAGERFGLAVYSAYANLATLPYPAIAFWVVIAAVMVFMLIVVLMPITATVSVLPKFHPLLLSTFKALGLVIINTVIFAIAGAVVIALSVAVTDATQSGLNRALAFLLILTVSIVAWMWTRPFRSIGAMLREFQLTRPIGEAPGKIGSVTKRLVGLAAGIAAGGAAGAAAGKAATARQEADDDDDSQTAQDEADNTAASPAPPTPPGSGGGTYTRPPSVYTVQNSRPMADPAWDQEPVPVGSEQAPEDHQLPATPAPATASVPVYVPESHSLPAAPVEDLANSDGTVTADDGPAVESPQPIVDVEDGVTRVEPMSGAQADLYAHSEVHDGQEVFVVYDSTANDGEGGFVSVDNNQEGAQQ